jgi:site-specific DNA recombinase
MARIARSRNTIKQAAIPTKAATVALYLRVSTEGQAQDGNGLDAQRSALLARCGREGWVDAVEFVDAGISGKSTNRPQFQAMMDAARAGAVQVVMAAKLDRIARNTVDFLQTADELQKVGVRLVMLEPDIDFGTDTGRIMATMFAAFAEFERKLIGQRVMGGKTEQAQDGEFNGSPIPFGYAPDWSIVEREAATVRRIFTEFNAGKPLSAIAAGLNRDGITTRNGKAWQHQQVKHIVRNGTYAGLRQWNGTESAGNMPAIVTLDAYRQAEGRQPRRGNPRGNPLWRNPAANESVDELAGL